MSDTSAETTASDTPGRAVDPSRLPASGDVVDAAGRHHEVSLDDCAREPIHIPNLIQPHGVLLAVTRGDGLRVVQASTNAGDLLGLDGDAAGRRLAEVVGEAAAAVVAERLASGEAVRVATRLCGATLNGTTFDVLAHPATTQGDARQHILELEPSSPLDAGAERIADDVRLVVAGLHASDGPEAFCDGLAERVQALTGFDRTMVYRFDADYNGEVVAERMAADRRDQLEPFLGLHYPATDIPAQARRLYLTNWIRAIPDVDYTPVPLRPERNPLVGGDGKLDLGHATLRSVSPLHVEYLHNMGVTATLTVSLVDLRGRGGEVRADELDDERDAPRLWGLIACHHYGGPHRVPYAARATCELIGRLASLQLSTQRAGRASERLAETRRVQQRLFEAGERAIDANSSLERALVHGRPKIADLLPCGAAAIVSDGEVFATPSPLDDAAFVKLAKWACDAAYDATGKAHEHAVHTDRLTAAVDQFAGDDTLRHHASGVLAIPLSPAGDAAVWVRPEVVREVTWAGDPGKAVTFDRSNGTARLSPRRSFEGWRQSQAGRSTPWHEQEVAAAREFRSALRELLLRRANRTAAANRELAASNAELDAFAYAAAHDLREPLRGIASLATFTLEDYAADLPKPAGDSLERIRQLSGRMDELVRSLLEFARLGRVTLECKPVDLNAVVEDVRDRLGERLRSLHGRVLVRGALPTIWGNVERVAEVFQNLVSNGLKYNDGDDRVVEIGVEDEPGADGRPILYVRDNGIGVDPKNADAIFDIFRRLHARDAYGGGTGAGLTIVRRVVERHGGTITVAPNDDGTHGTTFRFDFGPPPSTESPDAVSRAAG